MELPATATCSRWNIPLSECIEQREDDVRFRFDIFSEKLHTHLPYTRLSTAVSCGRATLKTYCTLRHVTTVGCEDGDFWNMGEGGSTRGMASHREFQDPRVPMPVALGLRMMPRNESDAHCHTLQHGHDGRACRWCGMLHKRHDSSKSRMSMKVG